MKKLSWMNGEYIKAMDNDKYYEYALPVIKKTIKKDLDLNVVLRQFLKEVNLLCNVWKYFDSCLYKIRNFLQIQIFFFGHFVQQCPENR